MKKHIYSFFVATLFATGALTSCSTDEIETFDSNHYLSFSKAELTYSFAFEDASVTEKEVDIPVEYAGRFINGETRFTITAITDKSTAKEGVDYKAIDGSLQVLPANNNTGNAKITVLRTAAQKDKEVVLVLAITPDKLFLAGPTDTLRLNISDRLVQPSWWSSYSYDYLGNYNDEKLLLLLEFMGIKDGSDPFDDPKYYYYTDRGTGNFIYKNVNQATVKPKVLEFRNWLINEKGNPFIPGTQTPIAQTLGTRL